MPCRLARARNQARKAAPARTRAHAHTQYARKRALPRNPAAARTGRPGRGGRGQLSAGRPKVAPSSRRPQGAIRKNYRTQKKTVLALIQCRCQIAVVRFGVCRFRANGVENDGVTPKRGKSGRSERGGKPREGTQPGCRKPEERPPRHGGCGARAGRIGRGGLRAHRRPGAGARLLPRHPLPVAVSSPATGNAAGGPPPPPAGCILLRGGLPPPPKLLAPLAGRGRTRGSGADLDAEDCVVNLLREAASGAAGRHGQRFSEKQGKARPAAGAPGGS